MPRKSKKDFEVKHYNQNEDYYAMIMQIFQEMKQEKNNSFGMSMPIEELKGLTIKLVEDDKVEVVYHSYVVTDVYELAKMEQLGTDVLKEVVSQLKKRFKKLTKKTINFKKVEGQVVYEKIGKTCAETSPYFGHGLRSTMSTTTGKYLVREKCLYEFNVA